MTSGGHRADVCGRQPLTESDICEQVAPVQMTAPRTCLRDVVRQTPARRLLLGLVLYIIIQLTLLVTALPSITSEMVRENTCIGMTFCIRIPS